MRFRRLPPAIARLKGHPLGHVAIEPDAQTDPVATRWLVVFADRFAVVDDETKEYDWFECEGATWREGERLIRIVFVDPERADMDLRICEGESQKIAWVVRERVQSSIAYQEHAKLPSGAKARGMVRRDRTGELFTQVLIDGQTDAEDQPRLEELETSLRDVMGMS